MQELSQCRTRLQSIRASKDEIRNKAQVAETLLQQITAGSTNLSRCISLGGRTNVDLVALSNYLRNGGFIRPQITQIGYQRYHAPPPYSQWRFPIGIGYDDRRRAVVVRLLSFLF